MGDDTAEVCCAGGICCDMPKQLTALSKVVRQAAPGVSHEQADQIAQRLVDLFTLVPKGLIEDFIVYIQQHPYK
jgi:hypothetical protein